MAFSITYSGGFGACTFKGICYSRWRGSIEIHDERGETVARRVVGVGALRSGEARKFTLRVEVVIPDKSAVSAAS